MDSQTRPWLNIPTVEDVSFRLSLLDTIGMHQPRLYQDFKIQHRLDFWLFKVQQPLHSGKSQSYTLLKFSVKNAKHQNFNCYSPGSTGVQDEYRLQLREIIMVMIIS